MAKSTGRPWQGRLPGVSRVGLTLLLIGLTAFGYGIVQRGLPSRYADLTSATKGSIAWEEEQRMVDLVDPEAREVMRQRVNELHRAADRSSSASREAEAEHGLIAIFGAIVSLVGIAILILHRRRMQNLG